MRIQNTQSVAEQTWLGPAGQCSYIIGVFVRVTDAATLGTLAVTLRWVDPLVGSKSQVINVGLTVLNTYAAQLIPLELATDELLTVECTVTSLLGTTAFDVFLTEA